MNGFNLGTWPDIDVTRWTIKEYIQDRIQSDGSSCGLFMLQFIEYWTGHKLSHPVTQEDVKPFRQKVAIILHESDLNDIKGTPEYHNPADDIIDTDGVEILDPPPAMVVLRMPLNKNELLCKLRGHIMSIHNADSREKEWIRSSKPYPLSISLRQLQDLLKNTRAIDVDSFNMAVQVNATDDIQWAKDTPYHYMDLRFSMILNDSTQDPKLRLPFDAQRYIIAKLFHCWPDMCFDVSVCKLILLPFCTTGRFILFLFDLLDRTITILDPLPLSDAWKKNPSQKDIFKIQCISFHLNIALQDAIPGWNDDVFRWRRIIPIGVPKNPNSNMSGFLVLKIMRTWHDHEHGLPVVPDDYDLRNQVLVHLLSYKDNECVENIPQVVRDLVKRIGINFF
ncbi:uncharacterized protein [Triticum aestivum]|uniref:uncharacterized protein n=2 Tax=Triticinae TaxID=1648030 RepID=UPI001D033FED|nr:uncharacterized protein LOC123141523 [Triticum aestivum]